MFLLSFAINDFVTDEKRGVKSVAYELSFNANV